MLICAEGGWVADWSGAIPKQWNYKGCMKYQRVPIYCLSPDGRLLVATPRVPSMGWLEGVIWRLGNWPKEVDIDFSIMDGEPLEGFKACLIHAIKTDDDLLTQFKGKQVLLKMVSGAESYAQLHKVYRQSGWA